MSGLQAIGVLIIRVWAAKNIFFSLAQLTFFIGMRLEKSVNKDLFDSQYFTAFPLTIWLVIAILVWFLAPFIGKRLLTAEAVDQSISFSIGPEDLVRLGSFLIGAYFVVDVAPAFVGYAISAISNAGVDQFGQPKALSYDVSNFTAAGVKLFIALVLMLSPRGLAKLFSSMRTAGLSSPE